MITNYFSKFQNSYLLTCSDKIVEASKAFIDLTGFDRSNFIGKSFLEICNLLKINLITKNDFINFDKTYYIVTKNADTKEVNISCQNLNFKKQMIYYFIDRQVKKVDISKAVECEQALKKQREVLYKALDSLNFPIVCFSYPDFNILEINKNAYDFISAFAGKKNSELGDITGKNITQYIKNFYTGNNYISINKMIKTKSSVYCRKCIVKVKNNEIYANIAYQPIYDIKGDIIKFLVILVDVTDEVVEKKNIQKSMDNQKEFFSFIAHEFRTPLTTMNSTIQLLEQIYSCEMTENIKKYISTLKKSTFQQLRLVNNLLDITRAEAGYLRTCKKNAEIVSITEAITKSINSYAKSKEIQICFSSDIKEKMVALDDEKYERILLNLLSNAIKFTPIGKTICVSITSAKSRINICIKDEGVGIPLDKQQMIFDRFGQVGSKLTQQGEGTGLGLYLVKLLVKALNGEIDLKSEENKGSIFTISLPDITVAEKEEKYLPELTDSRLIQSLQIEFSNIYVE